MDKINDLLINSCLVGAATNSYQETLMDLVHKTREINDLSNVTKSRFESIHYDIDKNLTAIREIESTLNGLNNLRWTMQPLLDEVTRMRNEIFTAHTELKDQVRLMNTIVKDLDDIAKDPMITRTIEDIKEISGRT